MSAPGRRSICVWIVAVISLGIFAGAALAAPKFQGVFMAGNYPGGATFDDFLQPSAVALANTMSLWNNWDVAGPNKNIDVLPDTGGRKGVRNRFHQKH